MRRPNRKIASAGGELVIHNAVAALPDPPTAGTSVAQFGNADGVVEYIEFTIWASAASVLSGAKIYSYESVGGADRAVLVATLNQGSDISLNTARAFRVRLRHSPTQLAYALAGGISAGNITMVAKPLREVE